jgi:dsDNA-specific endonuclease/ATPase MutS2
MLLPRSRDSPSFGPALKSLTGKHFSLKTSRQRLISMSKEKPRFKIGDRVEILDGTDPGKVLEIVEYHDDLGSQKLRVQTDTGYQILLSIELWRKTNARKNTRPH